MLMDEIEDGSHRKSLLPDTSGVWQSGVYFSYAGSDFTYRKDLCSPLNLTIRMVGNPCRL